MSKPTLKQRRVMIWLGVTIILVAFIALMSPSASAYGVKSVTDTQIVWNLTNVTGAQDISFIDIDGIFIPEVFGPYYPQNNLQPGTTHYAIINGQTYEATTTSNSDDYWNIVLYWILLIVAYFLTVLVIRIPVTIAIATAFDLFLIIWYIPTLNLSGDLQFAAYLANVLAIAIHWMAFGKAL